MGLLNEKELQVLEHVLATSPKAKRKIVAAVKEVVPDIPLPADVQAAEDYEKMLEDKLKPLNETIEKLQGELVKKERDNHWNDQVAHLKASRGWSDKDLKAFLTDLEEEFKEKRELTLEELAEYRDLKKRPLTPTQGGGSFFGSRGDTETEWRSAIRDPKSEFQKATRGRDNRKKKQIKDKWWNQAAIEWADMQRGKVNSI